MNLEDILYRLQKIQETVELCKQHHVSRDISNAALHASGTRYAPLTSKIIVTSDDVKQLIEEIQEEIQK